jgi:hypothetical protein
VPANGVCTFTATFAPAGGALAGEVSGLVSVAYNNGVASTRAASVFARVTSNAILSVTAPSGGGAFGQVLTNTTSANREWTITNIGEQAAAGLVFTLSGPGSAQYSIADTTCTATLAVNATCLVRVKVSPIVVGAVGAASVDITGTNLDNGPVAVATLSATGVTNSALSSPSSPVSFGTTAPIGDNTLRTVTIRNGSTATTQTSGPLTFTLSNTTDFSVVDATVGGCAAARTAGLAGNTTCDVVVTLNPKSARTIADTLTVAGTPGGNLVIPLTGTSISALSIAPTTQTFTMGASHAFTVTLNGATNPTASGILTTTIGGTNAASFMKSADSCVGTSLSSTPAHLTCSVTVTYTGTGTAAATLTVAGTTPGDTVSATLTGM